MAWADLSKRCKFSLTGPDRVRYLNGQVTNNVARLGAGQSCYALVCNHKGKLEADVFIHASDDALWVDGPAELREALEARLGKYLIADDCELTDVTDAWQLFHTPEPPAGPAATFPGGPSAMSFGVVDRLGQPGVDVWIPAGAAGPNATLDPARWEALRLARAIPDWGRELTGDVLPQEARLEERAVDFAKGCYVGQEVVSRLRSVGHVNRLLQALEVTDGLNVSAGDRLFAQGIAADKPDPESPARLGKDVGFLTSVGIDPDGQKTIALGYVRRTVPLDAAAFQVGRTIDALTGTVRLRQPCGPQ